ncbi:MAG: serine hydrolase domain-containing protein [Janthinobacterium lividum]
MPLPAAENSAEFEPANLSNWRTAPFSRWAFQHVDEIVPSAVIANGAGAVLPLPSAASSPSALQDFEINETDGSPLALQQFLRTTRTDGFIVLHDDRIVYEFYDNGMSAATPHILMSATKSVVGLIVGILHGDGVVDVEAQVSHYLPEVAHTAYQGATVRHLLDMRSGVVFDAAQLAAYSDASGWDPLSPGALVTDLHSFFSQSGAAAATHGGPFRYISANTDLLGWVIERASGQSFAALAANLLWQPMGAEHRAYITLDRAGAPRSTGGMGATLRDLARIGQLVLHDGQRGATPVVPAAWLDDISKNGDRQAWQTGEFAHSFGGMKLRYRSGWYVDDAEPQILFAMGVHGQNLFVDRVNRIVIAKLSSLVTPIDYRAVALAHQAVRQVARCLIHQ